MTLAAMMPALAPEIDTWADHRATIERAIVGAPRSRQVLIGPSEVGVDCPPCLAHKLAGTPERPEAAWLPTVGVAVHAWLANVFTAANLNHGNTPRYLVEQRVTVGQINGMYITGSADLYDRETATVVDWKVVGTTTMAKVKAHGPGQQYHVQGMLYGRGIQNRGLPCNRVSVVFLPRNAMSLASAYVWTAPYDEQVALEALTRADRLAATITARGLQPVLDLLGPHTGRPFTCRRMPDWVAQVGNVGDPFGL